MKGSPKVALLVAGLALIVGFFMPWLELGRVVSVSGFDLVQKPSMALGARIALICVPVIGVAFVLLALAGARQLPLIAVCSGVLILGYPLYKVLWAFFKTTGLGLWLTLAAGVVAIVAGSLGRSART